MLKRDCHLESQHVSPSRCSPLSDQRAKVAVQTLRHALRWRRACSSDSPCWSAAPRPGPANTHTGCLVKKDMNHTLDALAQKMCTPWTCFELTAFSKRWKEACLCGRATFTHRCGGQEWSSHRRHMSCRTTKQDYVKATTIFGCVQALPRED